MDEILVASDPHGDLTMDNLKRLRRDCEEGVKILTKDDYVIICGDFGLLWNYEALGRSVGSNTSDWCWAEDELKLLDWYNSCPWTTLFVDGNHENFWRLRTYPITEWHGGRVQKISESIIHLMRGEIYNINGYSIFTMGGAMSTDRGTATGTEDYDIGKWWWPEEIPSAAEWNKAYQNLEANDFKVDFIISHECPNGIKWHKRFLTSEVSNRLEMIRQTTDFTHWFCGHLHVDEDYGNISILYNRILPIEYSVY